MKTSKNQKYFFYLYNTEEMKRYVQQYFNYKLKLRKVMICLQRKNWYVTFLTIHSRIYTILFIKNKITIISKIYATQINLEFVNYSFSFYP